MYWKLAFCVIGIYIFFLTWAVLQEKITTIEYVNIFDPSKVAKFRFFIFLNMIQAFVCCLVSFVALRIQNLTVGPMDWSLMFKYAKIAFFGTIASPFGYESLRHINYPTMILGKSCKLVPVMLMNFLVYRKKFDWHKYLTVALITAGVSGFMLFGGDGSDGTNGKHHQGDGVIKSNSLYGLFLLFINLILDGAINSWQDQVFIGWKVKSLQLMFFMSAFMSTYMLGWLLFNPWTTELLSAIKFIANYPDICSDIALFCLCGALGQVFIFYTIEHFGSLSLVTVTVTRKLFTILISLFWFNHHLEFAQWVCVGLVFAALVIESYCKRQ